MTNRSTPAPPSNGPAPGVSCDDPAQPCPLGNLIVHIRRDSAGGPALQGVTATIEGPEKNAATTGAAGDVEFKKIQPGTYKITARKNSHTPDPVAGTAVVPVGGTKEITLVLPPIRWFRSKQKYRVPTAFASLRPTSDQTLCLPRALQATRAFRPTPP